MRKKASFSLLKKTTKPKQTPSTSHNLVNSVYCFQTLIYIHSIKVEGTPNRGNLHVEGEATLIYIIFRVFGLPVTLKLSN